MAFKSLGSLVRGGMRARSCFSSPAIAVQEAMGSAASGEADRLQYLRNALFYSDGRKSPVAVAVGTSAFVGSRFLHSRAAAQTAKMVRPRDGSSLPGIDVQESMGSPMGRGGRRFHDMRDVVVQHADGATATLSVVIFSVIAGILNLMEDTDNLDEARKEDAPTKTPYHRANQLMEEMEREMASYNNEVPDEKAVVQEYMEEDQAMRASFEEWMKAYGRTYKDEVEKARRFKIFKSVVRYTDALNDAASKAGSSARFGLNNYSDWNAQEVARLYGIPGWRGGGYFTMVLSYLAPQEIWHLVGIAKNKEFED